MLILALVAQTVQPITQHTHTFLKHFRIRKKNLITQHNTESHYPHNQNKGAITEHTEQLCNSWKVVTVGECQGFAVICAP